MATNQKKGVAVRNPHGVIVHLTPKLAEWRVSKFPGYRYCDREIVPEVKDYPEDWRLTEDGDRRRRQLKKRAAEDKQRLKEQRAEEREAAGPVLTEAAQATKAEAVAKLQEGGLLTPAEYRLIDWADLRRYATSRGAFAKGMTRADILKELDKTQ